MGPNCQQAMAQLHLPNLQALLKHLTPGIRRKGDPQSLSPLDEQLRASALGLPVLDGLLPWGALDALRLGLPVTKASGLPAAWAWLTPCHWQINADHVHMESPERLQMTPDESAQLMQAMHRYFAEDGISLHALENGTWLARGDVFESMPTASLARVRDTTVDAWMPRQTQAKVLRRLQNEMQMLLYTHPINDAREAQRRSTINSFWVSGTGSLPAAYEAKEPPGDWQFVTQLSASALQDDPSQWVTTWQQLDAEVLGPWLRSPQLLQSPHHESDNGFALTLCGNDCAQTFSLQPKTLWQKIQTRFTEPDIALTLQNL
jgi:hypothetical protein